MTAGNEAAAGGARDAIVDMEAPLNAALARVKLLIDALTPAGNTLDQQGLSTVLYDVLHDLERAELLWERVFDGTHDLRKASPPPAREDVLLRHTRLAETLTEHVREMREAAAIAPIEEAAL